MKFDSGEFGPDWLTVTYMSFSYNNNLSKAETSFLRKVSNSTGSNFILSSQSYCVNAYAIVMIKIISIFYWFCISNMLYHLILQDIVWVASTCNRSNSSCSTSSINSSCSTSSITSSYSISTEFLFLEVFWLHYSFWVMITYYFVADISICICFCIWIWICNCIWTWFWICICICRYISLLHLSCKAL